MFLNRDLDDHLVSGDDDVDDDDDDDDGCPDGDEWPDVLLGVLSSAHLKTVLRL